MTEGQVFQGRDARVPSGPWDVIVVGAGIYGLPVAFFLARRGVRVLVLEDNAIPGECITVNTGGIIRISYSNLEVLKVAGFGRRIYTRPTEALDLHRPVHLGFVRTGWGRFVHEGERPGILDQIERIAQGAGQGLRVEARDRYLGRLTAPRRANLEKILDPDDFTHVLVDDDGGFADGGTALTGFLDGCLQAGVAVSLYSRVVDFVRTGGRVTGVVLRALDPGRRGAPDDGAGDGVRPPRGARGGARERRPRAAGRGLGDADVHELPSAPLHPELAGPRLRAGACPDRRAGGRVAGARGDRRAGHLPLAQHLLPARGPRPRLRQSPPRPPAGRLPADGRRPRRECA